MFWTGNEKASVTAISRPMLFSSGKDMSSNILMSKLQEWIPGGITQRMGCLRGETTETIRMSHSFLQPAILRCTLTLPEMG